MCLLLTPIRKSLKKTVLFFSLGSTDPVIIQVITSLDLNLPISLLHLSLSYNVLSLSFFPFAGFFLYYSFISFY